MKADKIDDYKKCLGSEIYLLNQDYGLRSGCLWNYEYKGKSVVLYPRPFGVDEDTYNDYSDACSNIRHKVSEEEAFDYINGVRMGVDLMIESILGANSKIKMIF